MKLRVWHNSNLGNPHFERDVPDVETAKQWLRLLADYDLYLGDKIVANAQGLTVLEGGEWNEWENEDGDDIRAVMDAEDEKKEVTKRTAPVGVVKISIEELSRRKRSR